MRSFVVTTGENHSFGVKMLEIDIEGPGRSFPELFWREQAKHHALNGDYSWRLYREARIVTCCAEKYGLRN